MKQLLKKGTTDQSVLIFIPDSSSTTGAGKTGLAYDTSSLACYYVRPGSAAAQLSLVTQTVTGAHADGGFVEIDATNMPGAYRLDLSDAILASGVNSAVVMLQGASGMAPVILEIELTDFDLHTAVQDVNTTKIGGTTQTAKDLGALEVTNINTLAGHDPGATLASTTNITAGTITTATNLTNAPADSSGVTTLLARIIGTLAAGTHNPQSGDAYPIVNNGTYGNAALQTLLASTGIKVATNADKTGYALTVTPPTAEQIKTALEAAGGHLALILEDTGTTLPGTLSTIAGYIDTEIMSLINAVAEIPTTAPNNATIAEINNAIVHATYGLEALQTLIAAVKVYTDKAETMLVADGEVYQLSINALENSPAGEGGGSSPTVEEIDAQLTSTHGSGSWGAGGTVVLPVMQGQVYTATATQNQDVVIVQGDSPRIVFDLGDDYTGWTVHFGAKAALGASSYSIPVKSASWSQVSSGQGYVDLTAAETNLTAGRYFAEVELRNGDQRLTAVKFNLRIIAAVITE